MAVTSEEFEYFRFLRSKIERAAEEYALQQVATELILDKRWLAAECTGNDNEVYFVQVSRRRTPDIPLKTVHCSIYEFVSGLKQEKCR